MQAPSPDELEISVFGPGYGECILAHVGHGVWLAIDSCVDPRTKRPAPLDYLDAINVAPAAAIEMIVASHWHDDHVRGMHELLLASRNARFSCSQALAKEEFISLAKIYSGRQGRIPSGPEELHRCLNTISERKKQTGSSHHRWATNDKLLYQTAGYPINFKLTALSPSDGMLTRTQRFMLGYLNAAKKGYSEPRLLATRPNDVAVALLLEVNGRQILFGSDLEEEADQSVGWSAIMSSETVKTSSKSCVFKVAHHGANSGHCDRVWDELLAEKPLALLTPFRHGSLRLPTQADRQRILGKTDRAYISADPNGNGKLPRKATKVQTFVDSTVKNRRLANGPIGHVRWRAPLSNPADFGKVDLFGAALALAEVTEPA